MDVLERVVYNGFLSGVSLGGDEFFYPNPLASRGGYARSKWFECSCCPVNVVRFIPQIAQFAYAMRGNDAYVNLFVESDATLILSGGVVKLSQKTAYPWMGASRILVSPWSEKARFTLNVRVPGWCVGRPVPGDLYAQVRPGAPNDFTVKVNGRKTGRCTSTGFCAIEREWRKGDVVEMSMRMPVRRIRANRAVVADRGRLAVERGPILYCAEGVDNGSRVMDVAVPANADFTVSECNIRGNAYPALEAPALRRRRGLDGEDKTPVPDRIRLVPYFSWCHRGAGEMQCWLPERIEIAEAVCPCDVSSSHHASTSPRDVLGALTDDVVPERSNDTAARRLTFWPHKGTREWVELSFPCLESVSGVEICWFDDGPKGGCRLPKSWHVEYVDKEGSWQVVEASYPVRCDELTAVRFPSPVSSRSFRVVIELQKKFSAGMFEVRLHGLRWNGNAEGGGR